ncbi:MAG: mechanosensitive ion channel family protein, partial [Pseudomonadota bacterium]
EVTETEQAETPEQIEARKEAEEKAAAARQAEQAVVDFVDRKKALEEQISLDERLIDTARQSRGNIEEFLLKRESDLDTLIAEGASKADLTKAHADIRQAKQMIQEVNQEIATRTEHLNELLKQLQQVQAQQLQVVEQAKEKRSQAEDARKKSIWLESPLHPQNIGQWAVTRGPRILLVIALMIVLLLVTRLAFTRVARALVRRGRGMEEGRANRAETLALSFDALARLFIIVGGTFLVLEEAGVDIKTVLGGAAIIGLAIAFGAQNLMRDYFTGFMILLEDQYELGDIVTIGSVTGVVERVNMRTTVLRDLEGRVHFIPNGQIAQVTNRTYEWAQAVIDINIAYKENVDQVMNILLELADELGKDTDFGADIIGEPTMLGVDKFGEAAVTIKFMLKTRADKMWRVRREMLRRIKNRFDAEGIEIPVPHRILHHAPQEAGA